MNQGFWDARVGALPITGGVGKMLRVNGGTLGLSFVKVGQEKRKGEEERREGEKKGGRREAYFPSGVGPPQTGHHLPLLCPHPPGLSFGSSLPQAAPENLYP